MTKYPGVGVRSSRQPRAGGRNTVGVRILLNLNGITLERRMTWDVVAVVVGGAVAHAGLDAAAGHPSGKAARMMVATVVVFGEFPLESRRFGRTRRPR